MINLKIDPEFQSQIPPRAGRKASAPLRLIKIGTLIFLPGFATVGRSKERAFEQKEKVHKHFPLSR